MKNRFLFSLFLIAGVCMEGFGQLNQPERLFIDSFSLYPAFGYLEGDDYIIGGATRTCKEATIWRLDSALQIVDEKRLRHSYYEHSEVLDMRKSDTAFEVLTYQLQFEDVGGDAGIKWYLLNHDLEFLDSVYISHEDLFDGVLTEPFWVVSTFNDSLLWISRDNPDIVHSMPFPRSFQLLGSPDSTLLAWKEDMLLIFDSPMVADTLKTDQKILDVSFHSDSIFILTTNNIVLVSKESDLIIVDSVQAPPGAETILFHPQGSYLMVSTDSNSVYFYDNDLVETEQVQLFYDPVYVENIRYQLLEDGSIMRLGTTNIRYERKNSYLTGQEFGLVHRFDRNYSEDNIVRSDLSIEGLSLEDPYYASGLEYITRDSIYIVTKEAGSRLNWKISNTGSDVIQTGVVTTNILWGINCAFGARARFFKSLSLSPEDILNGIFTIYDNSDFPDGWEEGRLVYAAHPNGHYDADFSNNYMSFSIRYLVSSSETVLDPDQVKIWPNPVSDLIHIDFRGNIPFREAGLYDLQGRNLLTRKIHSGNIQLPVPTNIPAGLYFIRMYSPENILVKKVAVVR